MPSRAHEEAGWRKGLMARINYMRKFVSVQGGSSRCGVNL
jgi:hypothetical protein